MCRLTAALLVGGVALGFVLPVQAFEKGGFRPGISKGGFRSGFSTVRGVGGLKFHGLRRRHRFGVPAILDYDEPGVTVVLQHVFITSPPPRYQFQPPSVLDLPVQVGIREAKPDQPAVYALNDGESQGAQEGALRLSAGPKIIETTPEGLSDPGPAFGAKIVHLAVPVAAAR